MSRSTAPGGWREARRDLYHGIPVTIRARACSDRSWDAAWRLLAEADGLFNRFAPDSAIARLGAAPAAVSHLLEPRLANAIGCAVRARELSRGACDASIGPLASLWRRAVAAQRWPADGEIDAAHALVRLRDVRVAGDRLLVDGPPWQVDLDLGGVIKGVLVDQVAALLRGCGVADLLVQIGGETTACGSAPGGRAWRIGLQHPLIEGGIWLVLAAPPSGLSCSTSADYRRGWEIGGTAVSHLIDPRSGRPVADDLLTAHVAIPGCGRCGDAEALTKAVAILDRAEADVAVRGAGGAWLHLEAVEAGIQEERSAGFARLEAA